MQEVIYKIILRECINKKLWLFKDNQYMNNNIKIITRTNISNILNNNKFPNNNSLTLHHNKQF